MKKLFNLIIVSLYLFVPLNNEKTHQILRENKKIFKSINLEEKIHYLTTNDYSNLNESEIYYFLINGGIIINDKSIDKHIYESFFQIVNLLKDIIHVYILIIIDIMLFIFH